MSDGIGILAYYATDNGAFKKSVFRVAYVQSIDQFNSLRNRGTVEKIEKYLIKTWGDSKVFKSDHDAYEEARRLLETHNRTEFGITYLNYDGTFPVDYISDSEETIETESEDKSVRLLSLGFVRIPVMEYDLNFDDTGMSSIADLVSTSIEGPWFIHFDGQRKINNRSFSKIENALEYIRSLGDKYA